MNREQFREWREKRSKAAVWFWLFGSVGSLGLLAVTLLFDAMPNWSTAISAILMTVCVIRLDESLRHEANRKRYG